MCAHACTATEHVPICVHQVGLYCEVLSAYLHMHTCTHKHVHPPYSMLTHAYAHLYKCVHTLANSKGTDVSKLVIKSVTLAGKDSQVPMHLRRVSTPPPDTSSCVLINPVYTAPPFLQHTGLGCGVSGLYCMPWALPCHTKEAAEERGQAPPNT